MLSQNETKKTFLICKRKGEPFLRNLAGPEALKSFLKKAAQDSLELHYTASFIFSLYLPRAD